jgi:hypothetical protein
MHALELLEANKIYAALVSDTNLSENVLADHPHWHIRSVMELPDYHYLHKQHSNLVLNVYNKLQELESRGLMTQLQSEFGIQPVSENKDNK